MKARRLTAIRQLVEHEPVHSQEALRKRLRTMGFDVTQATLSRDIKELGLVKRAADGAYQPEGANAHAPASPAAAAVALSRALGEFLLSVDVAQQLVVLKTGPGQAQLLALAVDRAQALRCRRHHCGRRYDSRHLPRSALRAVGARHHRTSRIGRVSGTEFGVRTGFANARGSRTKVHGIHDEVDE